MAKRSAEVAESEAGQPGLESLEQRLGVTFRDRAHLRRALVHGSYLNENRDLLDESNERLEFLGDALIDLAVAHELYALHPEWSEGELTASRSAMVRDDSLARLASALDLGQHLLMGRGEEASGGRERPSNLAAAFEAVVGALFLDQGYEAARDFVFRVTSTHLPDLIEQDAPKSPKSALQEMAQGQALGTPSYRIVEETGLDHQRMFTAEVEVGGTVMGRGAGRRKAQAQEEAARQALEYLDRGGPGAES